MEAYPCLFVIFNIKYLLLNPNVFRKIPQKEILARKCTLLAKMINRKMYYSSKIVLQRKKLDSRIVLNFLFRPMRNWFIVSHITTYWTEKNKKVMYFWYKNNVNKKNMLDRKQKWCERLTVVQYSHYWNYSNFVRNFNFAYDKCRNSFTQFFCVKQTWQFNFRIV